MSEPVPSYSLPAVNRQLLLRRRPEGTPAPEDFEVAHAAVPACEQGRFLVRTLYLSADPVQRGWAANPEITPIGKPMLALGVGIVVDSGDTAVRPGEIVYGCLGWQDYAVIAQRDLLSRIPRPRVPVSTYAGVLGMPGVTAWLALHDLAPPRPGDTVLVSTAAGAVGSVVGQIARQRGARVIGLTGSDGKVARCIDRYGYHAAINYKTADLSEALAAICPKGFDIFFDNTGGPIQDVVIRRMAYCGRIIQCGTAATPSWSPPPTGLRNEREVLTRALTWSGFIIFDHVDRFAAAIDGLSDLLLAGDLRHDEEIVTGLEKAPDALATILAGGNSGKMLVFVGDD